MIATGSLYTKALVDLAAGVLTPAAGIDAMMLSSAYTFQAGHVLADLTGAELSAQGYARVTGAHFTTLLNAGQVWFNALTPTPSFGPMSVTDWRYVVFFNHASGGLYLCLDSGGVNTLEDNTLTVSPGSTPYFRLSSP